MFSNFKKAFSIDESNTKIPNAVVEALSDRLPEGFKYTQIDQEIVGIVPTTEQFQLKVKLDDEYQENFKPKSSLEVLEYLYRSQQHLEVKTSTININGHNFKPSELLTFPLTESELSDQDFKIVIKPSPFPEPFLIFVEIEEGNKKIKNFFRVQRQPYANMEKSSFKSIDDGPLTLSYIIDEKNHALKLNLNLNIDKAKNTKEVIEAYKVYSGFIQGEISFNGAKINAVPNKNQELKSIQEIMKMWENLDLIANKINVSFKPNSNLSYDDIIWIEKLYFSFVEEEPYKEFVKIDSITTEISDIDKKEILGSKNLSLQFTNNEELNLLGVRIPLHSIVALFDLKVTDITEIDGQKYNFIIQPTTNNGIVRSIKHYINNKDMSGYLHSENLKDFQNAKFLNIYK